jgi:hypothetical protein
MQSKLCLVLALAVLVGALAGGNPFLSHGTDVSLRVEPSPAVDVPQAPLVARTASFDRRAGAVAVPAVDGGRVQVALSVVPPPCPEPSLRSRVVAVRHDAKGQPIWVLDDGRLVRANPSPRPGQPKVVAVGGGAGASGDAEVEELPAAEGR